MLAKDILITGHKVNTLSGPCQVVKWEGKHVRIIFPTGFAPLVRPSKLLNGTVLDYHTMPDNVKKQLEEDGNNRLIAHFYSGEFRAFHNLQAVADYIGQHRYSAARVYEGLGYSSVIASIRDILN